MDALDMLLDEVALEGLDGITAESLWIRLQNRKPPFPLTLDPPSKEFLFKFLISNEDVTFYLLPRRREPVTVYDRFLELDPDTGILEVSAVSEQRLDVYPVRVVQDDPGGVQGSCLYYTERENVSHLIRTETLTPRVTLQQAHERWENKLVMVASQQVRYRALIGSEGNPELKLSDLSYCILERLGRARWQGEIQRDLHCLVFKMDAGKVHYLRKSLDKNKLITMQSHVVRLPSGTQQHSILLLLKRFHIDRRNKYDILMELTSNMLSDLPNRMGIMLKLRDQLNVCERTFKRVYQYMQAAKLVSVVTVPLQDLNPEAGPFKTKKGTDVQVRCLKLLKPYQRNPVEDEDEEDDEDGDAPVQRDPRAEARDVERDLLTQAFETVVRSGSTGISQRELRGLLNIGKLESRMICRVLLRNDMIKGFMEDEGRQRTTKYISNQFVEESKLSLDFIKERERSEKLRAPQNLHHTQQEPELEPEPEPAQELKTPMKTKRPYGKSSSTFKSSSKPLLRHSTPLRETPAAGCNSPSTTLLDLRGLEEREVAPQDQDVTQEVPTDHTPSETSQSQTGNEKVIVFEEEVSKPEKSSRRKTKEVENVTYRLLKRRNIIIEAVRSLKVIEGLYTLQKKLADDEKLDGVSTKVCKKSVLRLVLTLARDGFLKLYRTTVVQDGVSKKVEFVVHPSITPDDPLVKSAIEQVRFKISSSYTVVRLKLEEERAKAAAQDPVRPETHVSRAPFQGQTEKKMGVEHLKNFKPTIVPGLSRTLGFQPKMPRLRILHTFLWYLIYGHPQHAAVHGAGALNSDPEVRLQGESQRVGEEGSGSDPEQFRVYVNEVTWRRFIPVMLVHKEYTRGWALISDLLISLPLSIFIQIIQVSYKVEGLEEYLSDPIKQHYLIKFLPALIKKQLLYSRRYLFSFYENLQKLCYIGLMQFGPSEKFMEKDQCFIYLKKRATVVDTTACEPHYNLAVASRPFERRRYTFSTLQDVESYWFDLLCVCLNTPLGVIRSRGRSGEGHGEQEGEEPEGSTGRIRYENLQYTLKGSTEVVDDGVIPGDGRGAGGLDSSFFGHLKRNWVWTTHLLNKPRKNEDSYTVRLRNLLSKHSFPKSVCAAILSGGPLASRGVLEEEVQMGVEPRSRNLQVRGGKKQKRKRIKKEVVKPPKKKRKVVSVKKQNLCHDETDKKALMRMTKQRVTWTHLEDSVLILCRLASHFLNRKIKRPFVGWNVVRDILHQELELSLDKTSLAVGRRSRYIMKNPQTHLNYRVCLAEVYQDKTLVENFMNRTRDYSDPAVCAEEYNEFVSALRTKFSSSYGSSYVIIPDTKEELFHKFKVYSIGEEPSGTRDQINSVKQVRAVVLNNLIQSTLVLSNAQMNAARAFQSFSLFSQYNQNELLQVFLDCKRRGLLNRRRAREDLTLKKTRAVPFLPMSYQLSQHYYRFFTWRFPSTIHNEVYDLLEALRQKAGVDRPNTFTFQEDEVSAESTDDKNPGGTRATAEQSAVDAGMTEGGGTCGNTTPPTADVEEMLVFPVDAPGGATACCVALMTLGLISVDVSVPQQIVVVDSTLVDNEVVKSISKELDEEEEDEGGVRLEVKASQASHTNYLLMKGFFVPGIISLRNITSTEHIAVNSCTLHLRLRHSPAHTLFTHTDSVLSSCSAPPSFLTRMFNLKHAGGRSFLENHAPALNYTEADVRAVQDVIVAVETEAELGLDLQELYRRYASLERVEEGRSQNLQQYVQDLTDCEQMVEVGAVAPRLVSMRFAAAWLLRCPKVSETMCLRSQNAPPIVNGITTETTPPICEALPTPPNPPLKRPLEQPDGDIIAPPTKKPHRETEDPADVTSSVREPNEEVGGVKGPVGPSTSDGQDEPEMSPPSDSSLGGPREMAIAWMGGAQNLPPPEKQPLGFVARPWRCVDGSVNRPVCKGMLESVLLHIMTHPGVPEPTLLKHYSGVLQPVVILDLLKVLMEAGCVRKRFTVAPRRASLFSRPAPPVLREEVGVMEAALVFYEPTVDCCLRLSQIFPHEPNWNRWVQLCAR